MGADDNAKLAEEILSSLMSNERLSLACRTVLRWAEVSTGFRRFLEKYADKIRKKLKNAAEESDEKVRDVLVELACVYRLARTDVFLPEYEPYASEKTGNPDVRCCSERFPPFNLEIKRIREAKGLTDFKKSMNNIIQQLCQTKSSLGFLISLIDMERSQDLPQRLSQALSSVISQCLALVVKCERELPSDAEVSYPIEGFQDSLTITMHKIPGKSSDSPTVNLGCLYSLPYTEHEWRKFADKILYCLQSCQVREGMINMLMIVSDSDTHEPEDLRKAIDEVWASTQGVDDRSVRGQCSEDACAFHQKLPLLSCILLVTRWSALDQPMGGSYLWGNPRATVCLPEGLGCLLREL
jgi:hypothetical protein